MIKSPISILQEYVVQQRLPMPSYEYTGEGLSHEPLFTCIAKLGNHSISAKGLTKKDAKNNAATKLLEVFHINTKTEQISNICLLPPVKSKINNAPLINYIGKLNELCSGRKLPQPLYEDSDIANGYQFTIICTLQNFKEKGVGPTKKEAKQDAARKMLAALKDENLCDMQNTSNQGITYEEPLKIDEAIEKYTSIINNVSLSDEVDTECRVVVGPKATVDAISNWEDLLNWFKGKGWSYKLTCFQKKPLIMKLKINEYMLLKLGNSDRQIQEYFVSDVVKMLNEGVDFGLPLITR